MLKRNKVRLLSVFCVSIVLLSLIPGGAAAEASSPTSGKCGENLIWAYDANSGTLTIEGSGKMDDFDVEPELADCPWDDYRQDIKKVTLCEDLTSIGANAFRVCNKLESINIPEKVTSIGERAFYRCGGLTEIYIPAAVTSIGAGAFSGCWYLKSIKVDEANTSFMADASGVLYDYNQTTLISAPAEGLAGAYTVPDTVTNIGAYAFSDCLEITDIILPDSVNEIGKCAFFGCMKMETVNLPVGIAVIKRQTFEDCGSLAYIQIPECVTEINFHAFAGCVALKTVVLPERMDYIGSSVFRDCSSLTGILIQNVTEIDYAAFSGCTSLTSVYFTGSAPEISTQYNKTFEGVTADAYYPENDATWTEEVRQNYGGTLTWKPYDGNHPHDWQKGSCTEAKFCKLCGANDGEAPGHDWKNATCTEPRICKTCGETEGEALAHDFENDSEYCIYGCGTKNPDYIPPQTPSAPVEPESSPTPAPVGSSPTTPVEPVKPAEPVTPDESVTPVTQELPFIDVGDRWYTKYVRFVYENGIMAGVAIDTFEPGTATTRGMIVTMLARMKGIDTSVSQPWYAAGRAWTMENGVSDGTNMSGTITREQLATMLYRYAQTQGYDVSAREELGGFADEESVSAWAQDGMQWAVAVGLIQGNNGQLMPSGSASRAETATMIVRFMQSCTA